jgi:NADPH-dependent 2,4-dienoyl-CoA reductase/sulfur reductase-like enzyme
VVTSRYDIAVLGAGPAGLAAAAAAHQAGRHTVLIDGNPRVGGQYWRHRPGDQGAGHHDWAGLRRLLAIVSGADVVTGQQVWHVERTEDGFTLHGPDLRCRTLIVATGGYDRQLPFPGWTLPGVVTAGGAQALLKGQNVVVGKEIVVAGTGPFLLPVAAGLARAGARVVGVYEAGEPRGFARRPAALLANPAKLVEGAGYLRTFARYRIPYHTNRTVVAAQGKDRVESVTVAELDRHWRARPDTERTLNCDAIAVGYGFTPQLEIPLQLGCATRLDADGSLVATADGQQRASVPGVYLAGEVCGIGGADLSLVEGELAGLHAADALADRPRLARLLRRRRTLRAFAAAMHATYPVKPGWLTWSEPETLLCRCEEVTLRTARKAVHDLGASDARGVKLLARPGMGLCQGRVCGYATACLVAHERGRSVTATDLQGMSARPIAAPITLGQLTQLGQPFKED